MRLLVTGGRTYQDYKAVCHALDTLHAQTPITLLIHGNAQGADTLARKWAYTRGVPHSSFPAEWDKHGKAAGPIRNQQMLTEGHPNAYLAFPGGRGTQDMVSRCKRAGIPDAQAQKEDILQKDSLFP